MRCALIVCGLDVIINNSTIIGVGYQVTYVSYMINRDIKLFLSKITLLGSIHIYIYNI